ncbi:MAG: peroxide stress protein YaaA [Sphingomonadales bacterium]|nr:MAG: peroxide stress protein YaaA [Sphingomonadales bacterium]
MIALLSPAKTLDWKRPIPDVTPTEPRFAQEATDLAAAAAKIGPKKLGGLMHISPKLAKLNVDRYRGFGDAEPR